MPQPIAAALDLLEEHYRAFLAARHFAEQTGHTVPSDTRSFSEILVSLLTGIPGRARQKGSDLVDGSDVKAANVWNAIDTPRFNGCAPAGRLSATSRKPDDISAFDDIPYMFFVLWDEQREHATPRCRVWAVRTSVDPEYRRVVSVWYDRRRSGAVKSTNFQLHPPRNEDHNVVRNSCGNLEFPLFFHAERRANAYEVVLHDDAVLKTGLCRKVD